MKRETGNRIEKETDLLNKKRKWRNVIIVLLVYGVVFFFVQYALCLNFYTDIIRRRLETALCERNLSFFEEYCDDDTVFQFTDKAMTYKDVKKNIVNALNNRDISYVRTATNVYKGSNRLFFLRESYMVVSYIVNPYQGDETGFHLDIKISGYKKFKITKVTIQDPFWVYFFGGEEAVGKSGE